MERGLNRCPLQGTLWIFAVVYRYKIGTAPHTPELGIDPEARGKQSLNCVNRSQSASFKKGICVGVEKVR
jgi:hypothetical protein